MNIVINEELQLYIDPLTPDEHAALERSLLAEGCRDALVLWGDLLVDGHNRYAICQKHGIPFRTIQHEKFKSLDDVRLWMIENHLGRRSVSDYQRGVLALRKKEILQSRAPAAVPDGEGAGEAGGSAEPQAPAMPSRQALAREARVSSNTLTQIDRIRQQAAPELVEAVRAGEVSINAAAAVATLPVERQKQAVQGGRKELRMTAREVRQTVQAERLRARRDARGDAGPDAAADGDPPFDPDGSTPVITDYPAEVARLNKVIQRLTEERDGLKQRVMHLTVALAEARNKT